MLNDLKRTVCRANRSIYESEQIKSGWCNVSAFDLSMGLYVIKPAGADMKDLQPEQMLVMSMDGQKLEGRLDAPWDAAAHQHIYMINPMVIGSIANVQSEYITVFAQAGQPIPVYGVIHGETFGGTVPISRKLTAADAGESLADVFGKAAAETITDCEKIPAVLVHRHGAFVWGKSPAEAVRNAVLLEEIAKIAFFTMRLNHNTEPMEQELVDRCKTEIGARQ